jgi:hypothetical protein
VFSASRSNANHQQQTTEETMQAEEFNIPLLMQQKETDLINLIVHTRQKYQEFLSRFEENKLSMLEAKRDESIEKYRTLKANAEKLHSARFAALQRLTNCENAAREANSAVAMLNVNNNSKALRTRAEEAEYQRLYAAAQQRANDAAFAYSNETTAYRMAFQLEEESANASNAALAECRSLEATLKQLNGEKNIRGQGGFYIS